MPLTCTAANGSVYDGYTWHVTNDRLLVELLAKLLAGRAEHVNRVLRSLPRRPVAIPVTTRRYWTNVLRSPAIASPESYHRDGLLFQLISWVAAYKTYSVDTLIRPPHNKMAHKGVDNLLLTPVGVGSHGSARAASFRIIVCEDKATENPRATIRTEVWPSFSEFELGTYDHEMIPEISMMLGAIGGLDVDAAIDASFANPKHYRVSLALDADPRPTLFGGYDVQIPGTGNDRRRGEYLRTPRPLRAWMQDLSLAIAAYMDSLPAN